MCARVCVQVRNEFYRDTNIALLVFDVSQRKTFDALDVWLKEMKANAGDRADIAKTIFAVCANKVSGFCVSSVFSVHTHMRT